VPKYLTNVLYGDKMLKKIKNFFMPAQKVEVTSNLKMVEEPVAPVEPVQPVVESITPEPVVEPTPEPTPVEEPKAEVEPAPAKKPRAKKDTTKSTKKSK
jgi:outer membrane biosynthesis protein TonB